ncbi:MAG: hypothetical protein K9N51_09830 [Candidatus Pacebacteria bacterium]|nr:hypothetical protein [Candidatus Paceibacterota bacterium]
MSERRNNYLKRYERFERHARRYDGWFDSDRGKYVFPVEVECLKGVLGGVRRPWGQLYARKGREGHPFYSPATFYTCRDVIVMAGEHGMVLTEAQSCLFEALESDLAHLRPPESGIC